MSGEPILLLLSSSQLSGLEKQGMERRTQLKLALLAAAAAATSDVTSSVRFPMGHKSTGSERVNPSTLFDIFKETFQNMEICSVLVDWMT